MRTFLREIATVVVAGVLIVLIVAAIALVALHFGVVIN